MRDGHMMYASIYKVTHSTSINVENRNPVWLKVCACLFVCVHKLFKKLGQVFHLFTLAMRNFSFVVSAIVFQKHIWYFVGLSLFLALSEVDLLTCVNQVNKLNNELRCCHRMWLFFKGTIQK